MKKNSAIVLSVIGALAVIAAINPTMQAYAQDSGNTVTATQSNSFSADISQGISQNAGGEETSGSGVGGDVSQEASQGFCLQVNQQNAAAGNDATNDATNEIIEADCS